MRVLRERGIFFVDRMFEYGEKIPEEIELAHTVAIANAVKLGHLCEDEDFPKADSISAPHEEGGSEDLSSMTVAQLEALAERRGVEVEGTGSGGRVLKRDLLRALDG